jgi:ribosomal protein S18 acetylase RimI-like enzyme
MMDRAHINDIDSTSATSAYADGTDSMTQPLQITRTYLEMRAPSELRAAQSDDPSIRLEQQQNCPIDLFRFLYREVGRNYFWIDRLPWTDEEIEKYLQQPEVSLWLMTYNDDIAGYFELKKEADGSTEVAYFGLMPNFIGRGLGKHLLTCAVEQAWADGAKRVWLHTCTDDDPAALPNYLKRGFKPFRTEKYLVER